MPDYRFYLLQSPDRIVGVVDIAFPSDEKAMQHARSLLSHCASVDVLRGALIIGRVARDTAHDVTRPNAPDDHRAGARR